MRRYIDFTFDKDSTKNGSGNTYTYPDALLAVEAINVRYASTGSYHLSIAFPGCGSGSVKKLKGSNGPILRVFGIPFCLLRLLEYPLMKGLINSGLAQQSGLLTVPKDNVHWVRYQQTYLKVDPYFTLDYSKDGIKKSIAVQERILLVKPENYFEVDRYGLTIRGAMPYF